VTEVRAGQVWKDNDPRSVGRTLKVLAVANERALCRVLTDSASATRSQVGRTTRIGLHRFKPNSTGYSLLEDA
jgi:hypothetical protein